MKCPYCGKEMQKGEVQSGDLFDNLFNNRGGSVLFVSEDECKKLVPKKSVSLKVNGEGYYCEACGKVVGIFDERGADFWQ